MAIIKFNDKVMDVIYDSNEPYAAQFGNQGIFIDDISEILKRVVSNDDVIIDIGANAGFVSLFLSSLAQNGKIFAIEPTPYTFTLLETNLSKNTENCNAINLALSNEKGSVPFSLAEHGSFANHIVLNQPTEDTIQVPCDTLDRLVEELKLNKINFIKLDVEGHELEVLDGARKTLEVFSPIIIVEFNIWTQIAFGTVGPLQFLNYLLDKFQHVLVIDNDGTVSRINKANAHIFIYRGLHTDLVDNLLVANDIPERLSILFNNAEDFQFDGSKVVPNDVLNNKIGAIYASASWRITRPLRAIERVVSKIVAQINAVHRKTKGGTPKSCRTGS